MPLASVRLSRNRGTVTDPSCLSGVAVPGPSKTCDASLTVADLDACFSAWVGELKKAAASGTCENATDVPADGVEDGLIESIDPTSLPACEPLVPCLASSSSDGGDDNGGGL